MKESQKGFTLVEILTVIAIIAVLTALIVFAGSAVRRRAKTKATEANIHMLEDAIEQYVNDWHSYPLEVLINERGAATGGGASFLQDSTKGWTTHRWKHMRVYVTSGARTYSTTISGNNAQNLNFDENLPVAVSPGDAYRIEVNYAGNCDADYEDTDIVASINEALVFQLQTDRKNGPYLADSKYIIEVEKDNGTATGGSASSLTDGSKSWPVNRWQDRIAYVFDASDNDKGYRVGIISNDATTLTFETLPISVVSGDRYRIVVNEFIDAFSSGTSKGLPLSYKRPGNPNNSDSGRASSGTGTTLTDTTKSWPVNWWQLTRAHVWDFSDNNRKYSVEISSNDSDTLTFTLPPISFAAGDTYRLGVRIHNDPTCDIFSAGPDGDYSTFDDNPANYNIGYGYDE